MSSRVYIQIRTDVFISAELTKGVLKMGEGHCREVKELKKH